MDYTTSIYHDENEIINCRRKTECGDIEFYGYIADLLQELSECVQDIYFIKDIIKSYIEKEYHGDTEMFLNDISHCCDYYSLTNTLKTIFQNKSS